MKKTLLAVLFVGAFALVLTGCNKKGESKKLDIKGPRVVCEVKQESDGITTKGTITLKFDKDNYVKYQATETTTTFKDKEVYKEYVKDAENSEAEWDTDGIEYAISKDDKKASYNVSMVYTEDFVTKLLKEATAEEKEDYLASTIIKGYEDEGMKCKYIEVSKKDLGIE